MVVHISSPYVHDSRSNFADAWVELTSGSMWPPWGCECVTISMVFRKTHGKPWENHGKMRISWGKMRISRDLYGSFVGFIWYRWDLYGKTMENVTSPRKWKMRILMKFRVDLMIAKLTYYLINVWVYGWYRSSSWGVQKGLHGPYGHLGHPIPIRDHM